MASLPLISNWISPSIQGGAWFIAVYLQMLVVVTFLPTLPTPYVLLKPLREIAGASLVIYLTHFKFAGIALRLNMDEPIVGWIAAIVGGVILWRLYEPIDILLRRRLKRVI